MTDLDEALAGTVPEVEAARTVVATIRKCGRHRWVTAYIDGSSAMPHCDRCGTLQDVARSRRGTSSRRLGSDQERRIERVYGPRKVGEYGDAIDLLGRDFAWQSKATRGSMPAWMGTVDVGWPVRPPVLVTTSAAAMQPILGARHPLVIQSWVRSGVPTRDRIWVMAQHWYELHGGLTGGGWLVMSGEYFLAVHGRDAELAESILALPFDAAVITTLLPDAAYVNEQYKKRPSVYETSTERILRSLIAEELLARHRGAERADVRAPYRREYDVSPDIEIRAVLRPLRIDHWADVCLTIYEKDRRKGPRRWVLALIDFDRMDVRYLGWAPTAEVFNGPFTATSKGGRTYTMAGVLYPDELRGMDSLV